MSPYFAMWHSEQIIDWTKFRRSVRTKVDEYSRFQPLTPDVLAFVLTGAEAVAASTPVHSAYRLFALASRTHFAGVGPAELDFDLLFTAAPYLERVAVFLSGFNPAQATGAAVVAALETPRVKLSDRLAYYQHTDNPAWRVHCWFGEPASMQLPTSSFDLYLRKAFNVCAIAVEAARRNSPYSDSLPLSVLYRRSRHPLDLHPSNWCASWAPVDWVQPFGFGDWTVRKFMVPSSSVPSSVLESSQQEIAVLPTQVINGDTSVSRLYVINAASVIDSIRRAVQFGQSLEVGSGH